VLLLSYKLTLERKSDQLCALGVIVPTRLIIITVLIDGHPARGVTGADECEPVPTARPPVSYWE
jgi:hypothetical protein